MRAILIFSVLLLTSCATPPEPVFTSDLHVVNAEQLPQYWVASEEKIRFRLNAQRMPGESCGFVVLEFLIDSNGNVFSPEIIEAEPEGILDYAALKALSLRTYIPSETNPGRTPVKVTQRTTFKSGNVDCE